MEAVSFPAKARATIRRYIKWYFFPFIYFLVTSLLCAYAWYTRPISYRAGIKAVFKTIALNPTLILTGIITAWIIIAIILIPIVVWLKKRFPECSPFIKSVNLSQKEVIQEPSSHNKPISFWGKTVSVSISVFGVLLIVTGLSIALWVARPYITFLFATSKIETLEKKAELLGQVQRDEIKKKGTLEKKGEGLEKDVTQRSEALEKRATLFEIVRRDITKSTMENKIRREAAEKTLEKRAEIPGQVQEDWMIIPTALVDEPILDGVSMENLSEGVCHVSQSATPGQGGNCIIEGHNLDDFRWWKPQSPFNMIEVLENGVHIYIFYKGKKYIYKVKEKTYKDANDPKLYDFSPGERLSLITCTSSWDPTIYTDKRTVIVAYPE